MSVRGSSRAIPASADGGRDDLDHERIRPASTGRHRPRAASRMFSSPTRLPVGCFRTRGSARRGFRRGAVREDRRASARRTLARAGSRARREGRARARRHLAAVADSRGRRCRRCFSARSRSTRPIARTDIGRRLMAEALFRAYGRGPSRRSCSSATRPITSLSAFPAATLWDSRFPGPVDESAFSRARTRERAPCARREGPRHGGRRARIAGAPRRLRIPPRGMTPARAPTSVTRLSKHRGNRSRVRDAEDVALASTLRRLLDRRERDVPNPLRPFWRMIKCRNGPCMARSQVPIVMIGFGSIGRGMLPLIERHFNFDKSRFTVIDPEDKDRHLLDERGISLRQGGGHARQFRRPLEAAAHQRRRPGALSSICRSMCRRSRSCGSATKSARFISTRSRSLGSDFTPTRG